MENNIKEDKKGIDNNSKIVNGAMKQYDSQINEVTSVLNSRLEEISSYYYF